MPGFGAIVFHFEDQSAGTVAPPTFATLKISVGCARPYRRQRSLPGEVHRWDPPRTLGTPKEREGRAQFIRSSSSGFIRGSITSSRSMAHFVLSLRILRFERIIQLDDVTCSFGRFLGNEHVFCTSEQSIAVVTSV